MGIFDKFKGDTVPEPTPSNLHDETKREPREVEGKITKLHKDGWGFITSREVPFTRIFFHWTALRPETRKFPELRKGDKVTFTPIEWVDRVTSENKGTRAIKIKVVD